MLIKIVELSGVPLDWVVAKAEGFTPAMEPLVGGKIGLPYYSPSTNWLQGGKIINREQLEFRKATNGMFASYNGEQTFFGDTHLVAAMRCFCFSCFGQLVEVPDMLF